MKEKILELLKQAEGEIKEREFEQNGKQYKKVFHFINIPFLRRAIQTDESLKNISQEELMKILGEYKSEFYSEAFAELLLCSDEEYNAAVENTPCEDYEGI